MLGSVSANATGVTKKNEIKKIQPTQNKNNIVNLEVTKKEPKIFEKNP